MSSVEVIDTDEGNLGEFAFCGYKSMKHEGYRRRIEWLKRRLSEGLRCKILYSPKDGAVGFIEYVPGEYAWRAVEASRYTVIHCIVIMSRRYKGKGYGSLLVDECIRDATKEKMDGVAVVTSRGTWMAGKELFLRHAFELVAEAPPHYELLVKRLRKSASLPKFRGDWEERLKPYRKGLTIIRSDQCPYVAKSVREISETAQEKYATKARIVELANCRQAQVAPSAYGVFSIVVNGKLIADHPISNRRFTNIMEKEAKQKSIGP